MTYIKAIETEYKGYRFRSRLEARWAVFFDNFPLDWWYEPEGFILDDGTMYLPDFYFPTWDCYAEVKPTAFTEEEYWKANHLTKLCILLDSPPDDRSYYVTGWVDTSYRDYVSGNEYSRMVFEQSFYKGRVWFLFGEHYTTYYCPLTNKGVVSARSARFEFGQMPA